MGLWINSKIVEGYWIYPNGLHFEGKFENNRPKGAGVWHFRDGTKLEGLFEQKPRGADLEGIDGDQEEEEQKMSQLTKRLGDEIERLSRASAAQSQDKGMDPVQEKGEVKMVVPGEVLEESQQN